MKAAVLFPGQLRKFLHPEVRENVFNFLKENTTSFDFYCSFWDSDEVTDEIQSNYSPVKIKSEKWKEWKQNNKNIVDTFIDRSKIPYEYAIGGILGQWYQINKCFSLIENPYEYDIIIRTRTDITFPIFNIKNLDLNHLYVEGPYLNDYGYKDCFFFSNPKNMEYATSLFSSINSICLSNKFPHKGRRHVLAEHVFRSYVDKKCNVEYFAYDGSPEHTEYFKKLK